MRETGDKGKKGEKGETKLKLVIDYDLVYG
jgi:hypothetical protein